MIITLPRGKGNKQPKAKTNQGKSHAHVFTDTDDEITVDIDPVRGSMHFYRDGVEIRDVHVTLANVKQLFKLGDVPMTNGRYELEIPLANGHTITLMA